jgi:hypothetical protein
VILRLGLDLDGLPLFRVDAFLGQVVPEVGHVVGANPEDVERL